MRHLLIVLPILLGTFTGAHAQFSMDINVPGISIGINVPIFPQLAQVPGYPVYYDPRANSNYFFYDGLYWVYQDDNWYESSWYNGPWQSVQPDYVPFFVLRVPVRYYRQPPTYFSGWRVDAPPRWGDHWGRDWQDRRNGWDQWDHRVTPRAAPLPVYQRQFSGERYPHAVEQQQSIRSGNYRYQPRDTMTQQQMQQQTQQVIPRGEWHPSSPPPSRRVAPPEAAQRQAPPPVQQAPHRQMQSPMPQRPASSQEWVRDNRAEPRERDRDNKASPQNHGHDKGDDEPNRRHDRK